MYIVAFNGPPRSGKDTLAAMTANRLEVYGSPAPTILQVSLSQPLRTMAFALVGRTYQESDYEAFKEEYFERLDRTGRQLMIDISESFLKPMYGEEVMADLLIQKLRRFPSDTVVLVRDSGFQIEVDPLIREVGADNLVVVRVHRPGKDFSNDSREWVYHPGLGNLEIRNDKGLEPLETEASRLILRLRNQFGWKF